jgi:hypothetical protein
VPSSGAAPPLTSEQQEWLRVRRHLQDHRHELSGVATSLYPDTMKIAGTSLLAGTSWIPDVPLPFQDLALTWVPVPSAVAVTGSESASRQVRPLRPDGTRYPSYSAAVADLAAPGVFDNRSTYCLRAAELAGPAVPGPAMDFQPGSYFAGVDVGDACAHELVAHQLGLISGTPLRDAVGNPCDPARRPANLAISALTLRLDVATGEATFPLHWRDPGKVGHAGGLYMVMPVGVFQASGDSAVHQENDFSLWRCLLREYAEELLGASEEHGTEPIDYATWPLAAAMSQALRSGQIRAHVLGLGVDPLTLATDLLTVVTIESRLYDDLFGGLVRTNSEGRLVDSAETGPGQGRFPFTVETVERLTTHEPLQAAGAALIRLAWRHRAIVASLA